MERWTLLFGDVFWRPGCKVESEIPSQQPHVPNEMPQIHISFSAGIALRSSLEHVWPRNLVGVTATAIYAIMPQFLPQSVPLLSGLIHAARGAAAAPAAAEQSPTKRLPQQWDPH